MTRPWDFPLQYATAIDRELVARARNLRPLLAENTGRAEAERRLPDETIAALAGAGLLKLTVPKRYGGHEAGFATFLGVAAELGRACGSTAWIATLLNVCNWAVGTYPTETRDEIFGADPGATTCGVLAPTGTARRVGGGYQVTGSWGFASGCLHADWTLMGVAVIDDAGQTVDHGNVLMRMSEVAIKDTWYVAGMRGTGSNTVSAEDVFVPDRRFQRLALGPDAATDPHPGEPLYRSAVVPVLALVLAGPQLGLAQAALDHTLATIGERGISYTFYEQAAQAPSVQFAIAEAAQLIDTAALHVFRAAHDIDTAAAGGEAMDVTQRMRVRMDTGHAVACTRRAIDLLIDANGAASFAEKHPLQRIWRDANTAARHAVVGPDISKEAYGRALLGLDQMTPMI
ncbi:acyl-CoA dehydrogenase family protein [Yinghuangia soli]|uniref:Acyl-CoA dehydrogenase family protein n=1 Tax=Yinghuangia soli TaxID=2908204 RepID=A0AA41TWC7_9ACTN|nr:acyl-CoA dehydrogenase family protein [Yinghuangia soli]MCF2525703.1 acyl-CoA dehydrogenase family protein [Yinghuangia soli]